LVGFSTCFRKEAGSHGKDTKGLFRLHQFDKVEQFIFCHPDDSWDYHLELLENTERIFQKLGLPYRVVDICTGDLGKVASRKYDIEGWFPAQGRYRELASCSNCLDYQSYRLNIRFAEEKGMPAKGYVHTLNNTGCAIQRTLCCILENYQGYDGTIDIPQILKKYMVWEKKPEKLFYK
jgi:seryl-tRNA synthetase